MNEQEFSEFLDADLVNYHMTYYIDSCPQDNKPNDAPYKSNNYNYETY